MRQVDTDALGGVAGALGIANPATVTQPVDFDDGVLQQVLDVSRMLPSGQPNDGIVSVSLVNTHVANGNLFQTFDPYTEIVEARSLQAQNFRCWFMRAELLDEVNPADGNIKQSAIGLRIRGIDMQEIRATSFADMPLNNGGTQAPATATTPPDRREADPQIMLPGGDLVLMSSEAENIAAAGPCSARFSFLIWVGPKGLNPPGIA